MIEYIKTLFTKPQIELSALDKLAMTGIIVGALILVVAVIFLTLYIIEICKRRKANAKRQDSKRNNEKQMRKQICNEIKEKVIGNSCLDNKEQIEYWNDDIDLRTLFEFIDQVEKGE